MIILTGDNSGILVKAWEQASPAQIKNQTVIPTVFFQTDFFLFLMAYSFKLLCWRCPARVGRPL